MSLIRHGSRSPVSESDCVGDAIPTFLHFGYLPRPPADGSQDFWTNGRDKEWNGDESALIARGVQSLKCAFKDCGEGPHIVPLSGGLDSRAILGGLLDAGHRDRIVAVTWGTRGTYDFDIGCEVARHAGVRHEDIDLTQVSVRRELLLETARDVGKCVWLFDAFYNRLAPKLFGKNAIYWSGFLGDPLSGAHLPPLESQTWGQAVSRFVRWNCFSR